MQTIANTQQAKAWNGWEGVNWARNAARYNAMVDAFNEALFEVAAIAEDDRVLDIGCGTARITLLAAHKACRGQVVGVDISAPMLERARSDMAEQGIANVSFEQGDAQVHPFPDGGFDVAISRGGVMFFSDLVAAFANIRRGLRPRGRFVFMVPQGGPADTPYARATATLAPLMRAPSPASQGMGSLVDPDRIRRILGDAGFVDVTLTPVKALMDYGRDAADAAEFILGQGPVAFNLEGVDPEVVEQKRQELRTGLEPYVTPHGVRIPGSVWVVHATRPALPR